ncbi:hypothetical protein ABPG75_013439 [Micractinium tetrahymenae]
MFKRKAEEEPAGKAVKFGAGADGDRKATFARNLGALNSQFAAWVAEQASSAPKELWTDGVEDYLKHAKQLLADFKDVLDSTAAADKPAEPAAAAAAPAPGTSKPPLAPGSLFGAGGSGTGGAGGAAAPPASIFGGLPPAGGAAAGGSGGGFAFGSGAAGAPAFGGFGAAGSTPGSAANSGGSGLFNVPSTGTLGSSFNTGAVTGANDDEGEEEQQDVEPSVQVEAGEGTEMLAKQRVKLMSMNPEKKWKDKGMGTLTLRRATAGEAAGKQPYFVFTTDSGRVLINAPLVKGMKLTSNAKVPTSVIMYLISVVDGKEERAMHMFRCESPDAAKQLLATVSEHA